MEDVEGAMRTPDKSSKFLPETYVPVTMASGIRSAMARRRDKIALRCGERSLTFSRLVDRIDRVAELARNGLGLRPGDRAAIVAHNCLEFIEIVDGLAEAGVAAATPNPNQTLHEIQFILNDCGARVAFVTDETEPMVREADCPSLQRIVVIGEDYEDQIACARPGAARCSVAEWDAFAITYTSGTTGRARGVVLPHRARTIAALCMASEYGCYGPDDRFLAATPLCHGAGYNFAHASVFFGGTCEILERFEPELTLRALSESRATGTFFVPTIFHAILALDGPVLDRWRSFDLKALMSNAAPLPQLTKERIVGYFGEGLLHELYGSTEGGIVCNLRPADQLRKQRCVGHPFTLNDVKLLDDEGRPTAPGEVGELFNISPCLFLGYWNNPDATAASMRDGWFSAGDLATQDEEGFYYIVDRKKDMYISGGVNVYPREIEEFLIRLPGVSEAAVVGVPDPYWGEIGKAFLVMQPDARCSAEDVIAACKENFAGYKAPRHAARIAALPRNSAGKVLKTELRKLV